MARIVYLLGWWWLAFVALVQIYPRQNTLFGVELRQNVATFALGATAGILGGLLAKLQCRSQRWLLVPWRSAVVGGLVATFFVGAGQVIHTSAENIFPILIWGILLYASIKLRNLTQLPILLLRMSLMLGIIVIVVFLLRDGFFATSPQVKLDFSSVVAWSALTNLLVEQWISAQE